jgi:predicted transcriptional regulator
MSRTVHAAAKDSAPVDPARSAAPEPSSHAEIPDPTPGELEILQVLWSRGVSTVRRVQEELSHRKVGYTTVLKMLQLMYAKGLVHRDEKARSHLYSPAIEREEIESRLVSDLLNHAFEGSASRLVLHALQVEPASREEIEEIRRFLDRVEEEAS